MGAVGVGVALLGAVVVAQDAAPDRQAFAAFVEKLKQIAVERGVAAAVVDEALTGLEPLDVAVERDRSQPESVLSVDQYITRRLTRAFVREARARRAAHRRLAARVAARYRVPARVLVAVWGLESNFGRFVGVRPTVQALATLAWDGRRGAMFTSELVDALRIVESGDVTLAAMRGSWAGAMGQTQFLPSSYLAHAQDFDADGRRDIWASVPDVLASIARYLQASGWQAGQTWGREVRLPSGGALALLDRVGRRDGGCRAERELSVPRPLAEWQAMGVRTAAGGRLPRVRRDASLLDAGGRAYLVYANYDALLAYNCAHAYALAVGVLSDRLAP